MEENRQLSLHTVLVSSVVAFQLISVQAFKVGVGREESSRILGNGTCWDYLGLMSISTRIRLQSAF